MDTSSAIKEAIRIVGGLNKFSDAIGVGNYQTVQQWIKSGSVPPKYCPEIEKATAGAVRCEDLQGDVDWSFLRGTEPAPKPVPRFVSESGAKKEGSRSAEQTQAGARPTSLNNEAA